MAQAHTAIEDGGADTLNGCADKDTPAALARYEDETSCAPNEYRLRPRYRMAQEQQQCGLGLWL